MNKQTTNYENSSNILIVGGGMSGLFAAWRLLNEVSPGPKVTLVEKQDQVGGRLETTFVDITGKDGKKYSVHDEDGGMRFVPEGSGMQHLWKLINQLGDDYNLHPVDFVMGDENNRYYLRGRSFTQKEVKKTDNWIWSELYNLGNDEHQKNPSDILTKVMDDILEQNGWKTLPKGPGEWIKFRNTCTYKDYDGKPVIINKWGFWSLLRRYGLTNECIEMLSHVIGFMGPFEKYINAGEGLQILFDFPTPNETPFKTLAEGFQALPNALAKEIKKLGGSIVLEETITSINQANGSFIATGKKGNYKAEKLILAIPKKPLKQLMKYSPVLSSNPSFIEAVNSVKNMELTKIGLYFSERWWHTNPSLKITNGPNFTDLPMGSLYTFSQFPDDIKKDAAYDGPAAITQYTDYIRGNFWKELHNIGEMYQTTEFPSNPPGTAPASKALVEEMMKQIKLLFGLDENDPSVPMPVLSTYRVWGQGEYDYGYHQYKINTNDMKDVYPHIYNPASNIYVCNESWSPEQGWVEGALIMSDLVMTKGFGLAPFATDNIAKLIPSLEEVSHHKSNV